MIVYTKPQCPNCEIVRGHLALRGILFTTVCLDTPKNVAAFKEKYPGARSAPYVTFDDGTPIGAFAKFKEYLRTI